MELSPGPDIETEDSDFKLITYLEPGISKLDLGIENSILKPNFETEDKDLVPGSRF